jgi:hypothetical protein
MMMRMMMHRFSDAQVRFAFHFYLYFLFIHLSFSSSFVSDWLDLVEWEVVGRREEPGHGPRIVMSILRCPSKRALSSLLMFNFCPFYSCFFFPIFVRSIIVHLFFWRACDMHR